MIKILELVAEGGRLAVFGRQIGDAWRYVLIVDAPSLAGHGDGARETPLATWEEVLQNLERYPWRTLRPRFVHPDFAERILAAARGGGSVH